MLRSGASLSCYHEAFPSGCCCCCSWLVNSLLLACFFGTKAPSPSPHGALPAHAMHATRPFFSPSSPPSFFWFFSQLSSSCLRFLSSFLISCCKILILPTTQPHHRHTRLGSIRRFEPQSGRPPAHTHTQRPTAPAPASKFYFLPSPQRQARPAGKGKTKGGRAAHRARGGQTPGTASLRAVLLLLPACGPTASLSGRRVGWMPF
jgi:hypothetical protein